MLSLSSSDPSVMRMTRILRVHRHRHRQRDAQLLGGGALLERHAAVGDAGVVEREPVDRHLRRGDRVGLLLVERGDLAVRSSYRVAAASCSATSARYAAARTAR
jgi:hypothetical protein